MSLHTITKTAKAIGIITWAADKVLKFTGNTVKTIVNRLRKKRLYNITISTKDGIIVETYQHVNRHKIDGILRSMEDIKNLRVDIEDYTHFIKEEVSNEK